MIVDMADIYTFVNTCLLADKTNRDEQITFYSQQYLANNIF